MLSIEPSWATGLRHALIRMEKIIAGSALLVLLLLVFGQVLARNLFETSIPVADILSRYLVLYITFFGATLAIESQRHIKLDIIATIMTPGQRRLLKPPLYLLSAILCAVLAWSAGRFWYDDWQYIADHERWSSILALVIPFGFLLLSLHFLIGGLFTPAEDSEST
jgi:TRAP-type C4-dicarboxylate transport system permease small subunit